MINHVEHVEHVEELKTLASEVGQIAYGVHEYFGTGLLEKVYETALEHRLKKGGYKVYLLAQHVALQYSFL